MASPISGYNEQILLQYDEAYCASSEATDLPPEEICAQMNADAADIDETSACYLDQTNHATNATAWVIGSDQVAWIRVRDETCSASPNTLACRIVMARQRLRVIINRPNLDRRSNSPRRPKMCTPKVNTRRCRKTRYHSSVPQRKSQSYAVIYLIASFKLFKGIVLLAVGLGALRLLHRDAAIEVYRWANAFRVDPGNRYIHRLFLRVSLLSPKTLRELSIGTFFYSALLLTEGTGLFLRKHWAEYFTIIATASFIPLETFELIRGASFPKGTVLVLNVAIVAYLVHHLRISR